MSTELDQQSDHPLGPLAPLAATAYEWRQREMGRGQTWAGLWRTDQRAMVRDAIHEHCDKLDAATAKRLVRTGRLPGVRDTSRLIAVLVPPYDDADQTDVSPDDPESEPEEEEQLPFGIPIFDHDALDQAALAEVRHAKHIVRHLDDFHEPTLATLRRRLIRGLADADDADQRRAAGHRAADMFLKEPVRWRDEVVTTIYRSTVRNLEAVFGRRLRGPRRTNKDLVILIESAINSLHMGGAHTIAHEIRTQLDTRLARLEQSRVVLMYQEHSYLQLTGVAHGTSVRRHLPRGLHLIFSDQQHRRDDRIAGLWLATSDDARHAGPYHYASVVPAEYAERKRHDYFRLRDEDAIRRYVDEQV